MKTFLIGVICGAILGGLGVFFYGSRLVAQTALLQQDIKIEECEQLTSKAYTDESPKVALWALSNYLDSVEENYAVRPAKDKHYYYLVFKGHARLMRLFSTEQDNESKTAHLRAAVDVMKHWAHESSTNEESVIALLKKIDQAEVAQVSH